MMKEVPSPWFHSASSATKCNRARLLGALDTPTVPMRVSRHMYLSRLQVLVPKVVNFSKVRLV